MLAAEDRAAFPLGDLAGLRRRGGGAATDRCTLQCMDRRPEPDALARIPIVFQAGTHELKVTMSSDWSWSCAVDGAVLQGRFEKQVEAWEAGVREADRLDRAKTVP